MWDALLGSGAYGSEVRQLVDRLRADDAYRAWFDQLGLDTLVLDATYLDDDSLQTRPRRGARKVGDELRLRVVVGRAELTGLNDAERAALARGAPARWSRPGRHGTQAEPAPTSTLRWLSRWSPGLPRAEKWGTSRTGSAPLV